jgi:hypothetical protein
MTQIDFTRAIPDRFLSRTGAVVMGLIVGTTLLTGMLAYGWLFRRLTEPTQAPACYWPDVADYTPRNDTMPLRGAKERDGFSPDQRRDAPYVDQLKQAETVCTPASCGGEALKTYRSALYWYLSTRLRDTRRLDSRYGDPGLRRARENYDTPADRQIEEALRVRYRAGVFRINDFRPNRDGNREAIAILVLKGGAALRPCRKADSAHN